MMTTNMKDYFFGEIEEKVRKIFEETIEGQFEHNLHNKSFSNQIDSEETYTWQQRFKWWLLVVDRGGPIPNDVYGYSFDELLCLYRNAIDPKCNTW